MKIYLVHRGGNNVIYDVIHAFTNKRDAERCISQYESNIFSEENVEYYEIQEIELETTFSEE